MIFFFDRNVGTTIPKVLGQFRLPSTGSEPPVRIEYHQKHFRANTHDDEWLAIVGDYEWIVLGQDSKFHQRPNELAAIKEHNVGCF
ncbi:MAG: hypothetical protein HY675_22900 [Chloroflexi bacterium]|nr:hypothetical protein [Chloroflexota bacterium]